MLLMMRNINTMINSNSAYLPVLLMMYILLFAASCSSLSGKGPVEVRAARSIAETHIEAANKQSDRGNYTRALEMLEEGRRIAVAVDDPELLVRTSLAYGNIYYYLGKENDAQSFWNDALQTAEEAGNTELIAICTIYLARYKLLSNSGDSAVANAVKKEIQDTLPLLKKDSLNAADGWIVASLAEKDLGNRAAAEAHLQKAIAIHTKKNSLELAAYDWYLLASVYSMWNSWSKAISAVQTALALDRRAENSHGLGSDYLALGDIYTKAGNTAKAAAMYQRSRSIFIAARMEHEAAEAQDRLITAKGGE
jgi:tetratricopeptide (TPR) repeat protein